MQPRIFSGKKGDYNKLILKTLYKNGYLTSWNIAKKIVFETKKFSDGDWYHKTQKINSVFQRKGGRIKELENKQYIQNTERGYRLTTYKGISVALLLFEDVEECGLDELPIILQYVDEQLHSEFKEILDIYNELYQKTEVHQEIKDATKLLLEEGLDFDVISNRKFNFYLKRQLEEKTQKLFLQKDLPPVNPEVYAKGLNLLKKLRKTFTEQVREVEKAMLSVEESLSKNENKNKRNIENKEET